ncbi:MAG: methyltransferase [Acidobacteriota bacterium]|nr:methyltransferase [Acidobacteriota bacterium]
MRTAFVWIGALLFAVSLASGALVYGLHLGVPAPPAEPLWPAVAINVALFTVFALHHSLLARTGAKAWITRSVPADLERSVYVWVASLLFIAVCWLWQPLPGVAWTFSGVWSWGMWLVVLTGASMTGRAASAIGVWELAGVRVPAPDRPVVFTTTGLFGFVRHPIYLAWILMVFAVHPMTNSRLLFAVISTVYLIVAIPLEEASLVEAFGDRYRTYQKEVRSRLLPGIW